jgi:hypothetical protein
VLIRNCFGHRKGFRAQVESFVNAAHLRECAGEKVPAVNRPIACIFDRNYSRFCHGFPERALRALEVSGLNRRQTFVDGRLTLS